MIDIPVGSEWKNKKTSRKVRIRSVVLTREPTIEDRTLYGPDVSIKFTKVYYDNISECISGLRYRRKYGFQYMDNFLKNMERIR